MSRRDHYHNLIFINHIKILVVWNKISKSFAQVAYNFSEQKTNLISFQNMICHLIKMLSKSILGSEKLPSEFKKKKTLCQNLYVTLEVQEDCMLKFSNNSTHVHEKTRRHVYNKYYQ